MSEQLPQHEHPTSEPTPVKGYKPLTEEQRNIMNRIKEAEIMVGKLWLDINNTVSSEFVADARSMATAKTHLQTAFMWFNRGVAQPDDFYQ